MGVPRRAEGGGRYRSEQHFGLGTEGKVESAEQEPSTSVHLFPDSR